MNIWEDFSYLRNYKGHEEFISRGLARRGVYWIRFEYKATPGEIAERQKRLAELDNQNERERYTNSVACVRNAAMASVMEKISEHFTTYQYKDGRSIKVYASDEWELFFWCNYAEINGVRQRDYRYFTLAPNKYQHTLEREAEVIDRLLAFLRENFADTEALDVAVQYEVRYDDVAIALAAQEAAERYHAHHCTWRGMEGKLVKLESGVWFMKKRARTRGYQLDNKDVLLIAWALDAQWEKILSVG